METTIYSEYKYEHAFTSWKKAWYPYQMSWELQVNWFKYTLEIYILTLMLPVANSTNTKWCKKAKEIMETWVFIWEHSARAFQWIPSWQCLVGYRKSLHPCSHSIGRVKKLFTEISSGCSKGCFWGFGCPKDALLTKTTHPVRRQDRKAGSDTRISG